MKRTITINAPKFIVENDRIKLTEGKVTQEMFPWKVRQTSGQIKYSQAHLRKLIILNALIQGGYKDILTLGKTLTANRIIKNPRSIFAYLKQLRRTLKGTNITLPKPLLTTSPDRQVRQAVHELLAHNKLLTAREIADLINQHRENPVPHSTTGRIMTQIRRKGRIKIPSISRKRLNITNKKRTTQFPAWLINWFGRTEKGQNRTNYEMLREYYTRLWLRKKGAAFFYWKTPIAEKIIRVVSRPKMEQKIELAHRFAEFAIERLPRTLGDRVISGTEHELHLGKKPEVIRNLFGFLKTRNQIVLSDFAVNDLAQKMKINVENAQLVANILRWKSNGEIGESNKSLLRKIAEENAKRKQARTEGKKVSLIDPVIAVELIKLFNQMQAIEKAGQLPPNTHE